MDSCVTCTAWVLRVVGWWAVCRVCIPLLQISGIGAFSDTSPSKYEGGLGQCVPMGNTVHDNGCALVTQSGCTLVCTFLTFDIFYKKWLG